MNSVLLRFLLGSTVLVSLACKQMDPNPELKDPIFADLSKKHSDYDKEAVAARARLPEILERLSKAEARSIDVKSIQVELAKERTTLKKAEQEARYYKIRAERRKLDARIQYRKAFAAGQPWPEPGEYSDYLMNIRLRETNLNWNARVPRLQSRQPTAAPKPQPAPAAAH